MVESTITKGSRDNCRKGNCAENSPMLYYRTLLVARLAADGSQSAPTRSKMCDPLSVCTTPLISLTRSPNAASSKGFCIWPRLNMPCRITHTHENHVTHMLSYPILQVYESIGSGRVVTQTNRQQYVRSRCVARPLRSVPGPLPFENWNNHL